MISRAVVRSLVDRSGEPGVTSVYLDVDGRHRPAPSECQKAFDQVVSGLPRQVRRDFGDEAGLAVEEDLGRMREWLVTLDRSMTRGVALFACTASGYFEAFELARPVRDEALFAAHPRIGQLAALLDHPRRCLVALIDRQFLRIVRLELGEARELALMVDPRPRAVDTDVELGGFDRYLDDTFRAHYERAAERLARVAKAEPVDMLILGGPDESVAGLEGRLPAWIRSKVGGRASVTVAAPLAEVVVAAHRIEEAVERRVESQLVAQLEQRVAGRRGGIVGLDATRAALAEHRVGTLLVADGSPLEDAVEEAIDEAIRQHAAVVFCRDMDQLAPVGAIERY